MSKIGFVGLDKVSINILNGIINANLYKEDDIVVYTKDKDKKELLPNNRINIYDNFEFFLNNCDIIVLSDTNYFNQISNKTYSSRCVISLLENIKISKLSTIFIDSLIIRVYQSAISKIPYCLSLVCTNDQENKSFKRSMFIFKCMGIVEIIDEQLFDDAVPVLDSLPQLFLEKIESNIKLLEDIGIEKSKANKLAFMILMSTSKIALENNVTASELSSLIKK